MRQAARRLAAVGLSVLLAASPLLGGCAKEEPRDVDGEEMTRDATELQADDGTNVLSVDYNEEGSYTVSFAESDLVTYDDAISIAPEVAAKGADEEMARGIASEESTDQALVVEEDSAQDGQSEVLADDEGLEVLGDAESAELPEDAEQGAEPVANSGTDAASSFAALTQDDIKVLYNAPTDDGTSLVEREATVDAFVNDGTTVTVSFTNPQAGELVTYFYTVVAGNLGNAVFEVVRPAITEPFEGEIGAEPELPDYKPDFTNEDIALPEGLEATSEGIVLTDEATDQVVAVVEDEPGLVEDMTREAKEKSYAEYRKGDKFWNNFDAVVNYTVDDLAFVSKEASHVASYGQAFYRIFKGVYLGNVGTFMQGATGLLKLLGIVDDGPEGVTNEDIKAEIEELRADVAELRLLTAAMYDELDKNTKQTYANGLQTFDNALFALNTNAVLAENIFQNGYELAEKKGLSIPAEDATAEEEHEFHDQLVMLMKAEESAGNSKFRDFSQIITNLRENFTCVAGELSKTPEFNPLTTYKGYWNTYFNYESQSWWLRQAYQANAEYQVKRAFTILAVYYNIGGTSGSTYDQLAKDLLTALTGMDKVPLGPVPTSINCQRGARISVYSGTLNRTISSVSLRLGSESGNFMEPKFPTEALQRMMTKCHGRTLKQDMQLAGLWSNHPGDRFDTGGGDSDYGHGLGFNTTGNGSKNYVTLIDWNGQIHTNTQTYNKWNYFRGYDGRDHGRICYVYYTY
jgi:hypothetical protein